MGQKRRLPTTIKQQRFRYSRFIPGPEGWTQPADVVLKVESEIVPPEFRSRKQRFLGYSTIFEALAVASSRPYQTRVLILYQSEFDPLVGQGGQSRWFGRFHLFQTDRRRRRVPGGALWADWVERSDLPANAISYRLVGLFSPAESYLTDLTDILDSDRFFKPKLGHLFFRPDPKASAREQGVVRRAAREFHAKIVDLLMAQGYFLDDEIGELKKDQDVPVAPRGDKPKGTATVDKLNLISLDASAAVRVIANDGSINGKELTKAYYEEQSTILGYAILIGEQALAGQFTTLLTMLDHEARHVLQNRRAQRWVDDWRNGAQTKNVEKFVQDAIARKRPGYAQAHYRNLLGFIGEGSQETRALNEMRPYLEQIKLDLMVADWNSKYQQNLVRTIGTHQYPEFADTDPTFTAMVTEWAPGFRDRYTALAQSRQDSVRALLNRFGPSAQGVDFAKFLLAVIDGGP
jgi:hypothetical protein